MTPGARVRLVDPPEPEMRGATGTVDSVHSDGHGLWVRFDTGHYWLITPNEIEDDK